MPLVSIITPCFNAEAYLKQCLESVLAQSFVDWELLFVDNNSSDRSLEIAQEFAAKDPRIKILECKEQGVSRARNLGLASAQGKYLALLDADDIWYPEKLEEEIKILEANPGYVCLYSPVDYIDEAGEYDLKSFAKTWGFHGEIFLNLLQANLIQNPSPILKTQSVKELGGFDEKLSYGEDWDLFIRLAYKAPFYFSEKTTCAYRKHSKQSTKNFRARTENDQELYLLEKSFGQLPCYLKKFKTQGLNLAKKKIKKPSLYAKRTKKDLPFKTLKSRILWAFKNHFVKVRKKDLKNPAEFKSRALSNMYFRQAKNYGELKDKLNTKHCIKEAVRLDPIRILEPVSLKLLLF